MYLHTKQNGIPEVVHEGGEDKEDLVDTSSVPHRQHEHQVDQIALAQQTVRLANKSVR